MYLILKRWLADIDWFSDAQAKQQRPETPHLDYNDVAFRLASADDISNVLPAALKVLQSQLNSLLPKQNLVSLLVLFSTPSTSESSLHHAQDKTLPEALTQTLHQQFTISKPEGKEIITLNLADDKVNLIPVRLFEHNQQTIWLFYLFNHSVANLNQWKWKTATQESTLIKGLTAWCQTQSKLSMALQNERAIYAAELHDSLAQILGYLKIKSAKLDKLCQRPPHQELKSITEDIAIYTNCAYHQTRELIVSSRLALQSENFAQAVTNSINEFEHQSAIVFDLDNRLPSQMLTPKQSMQILYIIRESLSNIVRHSHATHARLILFMKSENTLHIKIEDNGRGIDPAVARNDSFGLQIMRERAERIGADLHFSDRQDGGTCVELTLNLRVYQ
jgi:nitrate/nitrite-specific signal transduction histidine kinase